MNWGVKFFFVSVMWNFNDCVCVFMLWLENEIVIEEWCNVFWIIWVLLEMNIVNLYDYFVYSNFLR